MRFTYNGNSYEIDFQYDNLYEEEVHQPTSKVYIYIRKLVIQTTARVFVNRIKFAPFCFGYSRCQPEDRFIKETGRTLALKDAVKNLDDHELRTRIYECYFNRPRGKGR